MRANFGLRLSPLVFFVKAKIKIVHLPGGSPKALANAALLVTEPAIYPIVAKVIMPASRSNPSFLFALGQLVRAPNVFTAIADIWAGCAWSVAVLNSDSVLPAATNAIPLGMADAVTIGLLSLSSALLYMAGMVLNDVYDCSEDAAARPERPIPSGRVPLRLAHNLGWGMLVAGFLVGCSAGLPSRSVWPGAVAGVLAAAIFAYDVGLKRTWAGPLAMGACRGLNLLMGITLRGSLFPIDGGPTLATFVFVTGLTWLARTEERTSRRAHLSAGLAVSVAGAMLLGTVLWWLHSRGNERVSPGPLVGVILVSSVYIRRGIAAIVSPKPEHVKIAVKTGIFTLVMLDACIAYSCGGSAWALAVLTLLLPAVLLGRWFYST